MRMGGGAGARLIKVSGLSSGLSSVAGQVCDLGLASKVKDMSTMMQTICGTVYAYEHMHNTQHKISAARLSASGP